MHVPPIVTSVQVGRARLVTLSGREVRTASFKSKVSGPVIATSDGLAGDEQADRRVHGGIDRAICIYPGEHYPHWNETLGLVLPLGGFGENLTTRGLDERTVHIGDSFRIGSVLVEVSTPRRPCWKLGARWSSRELPVQLQQSGLTGFYVRVIESGFLSAGDGIRLESRDEEVITVAELNRVMNVDRRDMEAIRLALRAPGLPPRWRAGLEEAPGRCRGVARGGAPVRTRVARTHSSLHTSRGRPLRLGPS